MIIHQELKNTGSQGGGEKEKGEGRKKGGRNNRTQKGGACVTRKREALNKMARINGKDEIKDELKVERQTKKDENISDMLKDPVYYMNLIVMIMVWISG